MAELREHGGGKEADGIESDYRIYLVAKLMLPSLPLRYLPSILLS